ncbi:manganese efflux pump [Terrilactibacillus sp. S3-3]|nr:manganese efflux pump [Terrilactibacillus sp. S3-3]
MCASDFSSGIPNTCILELIVIRNKMCIQKLDWKQGIILGFALSFTNVAVGFGVTVSNASTVWITALSISVWGYLMIWLGNIVGIGVIARLLGKYSSFAAGLLLILVGIRQVIG